MGPPATARAGKAAQRAAHPKGQTWPERGREAQFAVTQKWVREATNTAQECFNFLSESTRLACELRLGLRRQPLGKTERAAWAKVWMQTCGAGASTKAEPGPDGAQARPRGQSHGW